MRPTKLEIQGLTAYRGHVDVDFTDLDLFAITGDTGAGKSSLVDAISFALFGQAPRVGRQVKELISQGEDRLKVSLEFCSNGGRYRIHRSTARKGQAPVQLERADPAAEDGWARIADRATEVTKEIEDILHMDYEAFVRSVLLPQGQFQEFLAGDRDERRKVLDRLLDLDVYKRMEVRANALARDAEREADRIRERLDTELADATPEALKSAKADLKSLKECAQRLAGQREATDNAHRAAVALGNTRKHQQAATEAQADAEKRLKHARELLAGGQKTLDGLDAKVADVQAQIKGADYDADLHIRLSGCLPVLRSIEEADKNAARLAADVAKATPVIKKLEAAQESARKEHGAAQTTTKARHDEYEQARHLNAAALLRSGLKVGDPCPVCGEPIAKLPPAEKAAALDKLKAAWEKAQADEKRAQSALSDADKQLERGRAELAALEQQMTSAKAESEKRAAELAQAMPGEKLERTAVEARIKALEAAKAKLEQLQVAEKQALAERDATASEIRTAQNDVTKLEVEAKARAEEAATAAKEIAEIEGVLRTAAREMNWPDVAEALERGRDPAQALRQRLGVLQDEERDVNQKIGAAGKHIEQIEANIVLARTLREQEKTHRAEASLARDLASLLRVDALPSFIRERALQTLALDGSRRLEEISGGRYDFAVEGQDFLICDKWNGGEKRSVKTLSGGETFLASLALALSLAEHLPSLAGNGAANALESLFIDEGFSHLDAETLDVVASALEVLGQDRRRLIGVITHVPALAERMPARITVHKSQTGSTVTVD